MFDLSNFEPRSAYFRGRGYPSAAQPEYQSPARRPGRPSVYPRRSLPRSPTWRPAVRPGPKPMPALPLPSGTPKAMPVRPISEIAPAIKALGWWYARKNPIVLGMRMGLLISENLMPGAYKPGSIRMPNIPAGWIWTPCNDLSPSFVDVNGYCSAASLVLGGINQDYSTLGTSPDYWMPPTTYPYIGIWHIDGRDGFQRPIGRLVGGWSRTSGSAFPDHIIPASSPGVAPMVVPEIIPLPWVEPLTRPGAVPLPIAPPVPLIPSRGLPRSVPGVEASSAGNVDPTLTPRPRPRPQPIPRPAPVGQDETKTKSRGLGLLLSLWDAATEAQDFVDAVFDALPAKIRKQYKGRDVISKSVFVGRHLDDLNLYDAFKNVVMNAVEDRAIGALLGRADKAGVGLGFSGSGYIKRNFL